LRTLAGLPRVRFEMLGIAAKYDVDDLHYSNEIVNNRLLDFSYVRDTFIAFMLRLICFVLLYCISCVFNNIT